MEFTVDLSEVKNREDLHEVLKETLSLPSYYGKNLDALYDVLMEIHDPWFVKFTGTSAARESLGSYFNNLVATFDDAHQEGSPVLALWS